jgi:hypothetical protein
MDFRESLKSEGVCSIGLSACRWVRVSMAQMLAGQFCQLEGKIQTEHTYGKDPHPPKD